MRYYVIDLQGAQYGPADLHLLNQWADQGRIVPSTMLVEESTGRQILASSVQGLILLAPRGSSSGSPFGPSAMSYGASPYGGAAPGVAEAKMSMTLSAVSLALCSCIPLLGFVPAVIALFYASAAIKRGARNGSGAMMVSILAIGLQILMTILQAGFVRMLGGG